MNLGNFLIYLSSVLALAIVIGALVRAGRTESWHRQAYWALTACLTAATFYLLYLFLAHRFEYSYVYGYSSRDLPLGYLVSSLWAGQEGTFLIWAFFAAILGLVLARDRNPLSRETLGFFVVTILFLLVLMIVKSPFATTADTPADGRGLNPLLQDPWMVIHPPVIFVGYAALAIPFAYALAALLRKRFDHFAAVAFPWVGFSVATLGAGIFIGGFWAYKVLGWGGYWGWDPVENSSLIPWLTAIALLHGLILFRMQPKLLKTNLALALVSYLLVVYGTFLTRSGVLADFSVHSFADLGINSYLVIYMIGVTVVSLAMLFARTRSVPTVPISRAVNSREFGLVLGILLLSICAALILVGTSAPLLTKLGGQASNVSIDYYNTVSLPLSVLLVLTLTLSPFLMFGMTPWGDLLRNAMISIIAAAIAALIAMFLGVNRWEHLLLTIGAVGALTSNLVALIRFSEGRLLRMAGHLTHFGFAVMLLGILGSSGYSESERLSLKPGDTKSAFGYDVTFNRLVEGEKPNEGYLDMVLHRAGSRIEAKPRLYYSDYTQSVMRNPSIVKGMWRDLYLAPLDLQESKNSASVELAKGHPQEVGDWILTFTRFTMGEGHGEGGGMTVAAIITGVRRSTGDTVTISPGMISGENGMRPIPMTIPGTEIEVELKGMQVEAQTVRLAIDDPSLTEAGSDVLALEASTKPLVNWVWAGVIVMTLGSVLSFTRRWREREL